VVTEKPEEASGYSKAYLRWALLLFFLLSFFNYLDRFILSVLLEPIRHEFGLTDTQLGLLSGVAFAVFYTTLGLVIARWADLGNRRTIITLAVAIWSLMTMVCGVAANFVQLFFARVGVGIGEAGGFAPVSSLIADYFPPEKRARAVSIFLLGTIAGGLLGFGIGGYLAEHYGWRVAFLVVGLPGVLLAVVIRLAIKEPRRDTRLPAWSELFGPESVAVVRALFRKPSYVHLLVGYAFYSFYMLGAGQFVIPFIVRSFDVSLAQIGGLWGLVFGTSGIIGTFLGGIIADRLSRRDVRWLTRWPAYGMLIFFPSLFTVYVTDNLVVVLALSGIGFMVLTATGPATFAAVLGVAGPDRRALGMAFFSFFSNAVGFGLGPICVGMMSDALAPRFGEESLRYALLVSTFAIPLAALHFWLGSRSITEDFEDQLPADKPE
jgi:predicted MFS family arabinose efflux permease